MATRKGMDTDAGTGKAEEGKAKGGRFKKRASTMLGGESIRAGADASRQAFGKAFADEESGRSETFMQARRRLGVDADQIAHAGNSFRTEALIYATITTVLVLTGLCGLFFGLFYSSFIVSVSVLCVSFALGSLGFRAAFRNWQIRNGRLGGLTVFTHSPAEWFPRKIDSEAFRSRDVAVQSEDGRRVR